MNYFLLGIYYWKNTKFLVNELFTAENFLSNEHKDSFLLNYLLLKNFIFLNFKIE
jgi:hypothetical protein